MTFQVLTRIVSTTAGLKLHRDCYITNTYLKAEPCNRPSQKSSLFCKTVKEIESQKHLYEFQTIYMTYSMLYLIQIAKHQLMG